MSQTPSNSQSRNGQHAPKAASPPAKVDAVPYKETGVFFRTPDGIKRHGAIVRVTPHSIFFEIHDPTLVLRLSEALRGFSNPVPRADHVPWPGGDL